MNFTILIPHYKQGQATAHAIYKLIQHKGRHNIDVVVIDNSNDDSINHILLTNLTHECKVIRYPADKLQSHGIAFDYAIINGFVKTDFFITIESDSFPTQDNWLDLYEEFANNGMAAAGSILKLSGGVFLHPCGAMYKTDVWFKALSSCVEKPYHYFPNMVRKEGFDCHTMVHQGIAQFERFLQEFGPGLTYEPAAGYIGLTLEQMLDKAHGYKPTKGPFHNGMGALQESIHTYGDRNLYTGIEDCKEYKDEVILRIGYEPGQWFTYFMISSGLPIAQFDTSVKWLPGRENQNQEYTITETGFTHLWGGSSFFNATDKDPEMQRVIDFKNNQVADLYKTLPENCKL